MSLIGTAIGALVALLPRPTLDKADPRFIAGYDAGLKDGRREAQEAQVEVERLTRSHARLVDHIETLEREFLIEQHISTHWKAEARERAEAQKQQALMQQYQGLQPMHPADGRSAMAYAQMSACSAMAYAQMSAQQLAQQADNLAWRQLNQQQLAQQAQGPQWRGDYDGFCNCVPSRAQVWGANRGEG